MAYLLPDVSCILMCCLKQQQLPCNYPKQGVVNLLRHMLCFAETNGNCHAIISWLNVWSTRTLMKTPLCVGMRRYINDDRTKHCFIIMQNNILNSERLSLYNSRSSSTKLSAVVVEQNPVSNMS